MVDDEATTSPAPESFPTLEECVTQEGSESESPMLEHAAEEEL